MAWLESNRGRLLIGFRYRGERCREYLDLDDTRESPSLKLIDLLQQKGAVVGYHDPYVPVLKRSRRYDFQLASVALTAEELTRADAVLIATDHSAYDYDFIVASSRLVVDTRNATRHVANGRDKIVLA